MSERAGGRDERAKEREGVRGRERAGAEIGLCPTCPLLYSLADEKFLLTDNGAGVTLIAR